MMMITIILQLLILCYMVKCLSLKRQANARPDLLPSSFALTDSLTLLLESQRYPWPISAVLPTAYLA